MGAWASGVLELSDCDEGQRRFRRRVPFTRGLSEWDKAHDREEPSEKGTGPQFLWQVKVERSGFSLADQEGLALGASTAEQRPMQEASFR
jgi:uncharacterized membrane protein